VPLVLAFDRKWSHRLRPFIARWSMVLTLCLLASCASPPKPAAPPKAEILATPAEPAVVMPPNNVAPPPSIVRSKSRWVRAAWTDLPGLASDNLNEAWVAWLQSCSRASVVTTPLCQNVKRLEGQTSVDQRTWLMQNFVPYRVESLEESSTPANGLLTAYYEPVIEASRTLKSGFTVPLYAPPSNLKSRSPWFTREEIGALPAAQAALKGKEIAFIADPVDAMILHIQGSGRLWVTESDGRRKQVRLAFAGTNDQPYQSIGRWLLDQKLTKDATWPGIKAWLGQNPKRTQELLSKNPRYVFFKEEALSGASALLGPRGAQGVPLTAGRSIAVDPGSIPYGTPVWLVSLGPQTQLQRLVIAQDTGSAILGAVRADYYAGSGDAAGELAGRLKQDMKAWVLLPR
jgi:membrane-bound lytic murein transglycosylase A